MKGRRMLSIFTVVLAIAADAQEPPPPEEAKPAAETRYTIDVLVRPTFDLAERFAGVVRRQLPSELSVRVESRRSEFVVRVGDFATVEEARPALKQIHDLGYEDASIAAIAIPAPGPEWEEPGTRTDAAPPPEPAPEAAERPDEQPPAEAAPTPPAPKEPPPTGKRIRATRISNGSLSLDGRLEDDVWTSVEFVSDFQKKAARGGFPAQEETEVAIAYDDDALYVGARVHAPDPASIRARRSARDDAADTDRLIVSLDTYHNRQTAYNFGVTAGGTRIDYYQPQDVFTVRDYSFDPVWQARTALHNDGWTAEMRIPFSALRFYGGNDSPVWGINLQRVSPALRLYAFWVVVPGNQTAWASRFGDLVGLDGVRPHRRIAVVPYVAAQRTRGDDELSSGGPFDDRDEDDVRYGGDFLMDLSPGLSLQATFNPDFGQIEADPAVVNLSAYEVFFPEKRPFFLEGAQLFEGLGPRYFYSRRIGAPPHGRANAPFVEMPVDTTIAGAAKIIGRRPSGWSTGTMVALTEEEEARTFDPDTGMFGRTPVEPRTAFGVSRIQRDFGAGSSFGFVGTGVRREFDDNRALETLLPREAFAGGADWNLRFGENRHEFGGFVGASLVEGDPAAILRLQRSSARYLQRPDADYVGLDPTRDSLEGYTAGLRLGRIEGPLRWTLSGEARSPGFEINDTGAMPTADDISVSGDMSYYSTFKNGPLRRADIFGSIASGWNFGDVRQYTTPQVGLRVISRNFWKTNFQLTHDMSALSDSLTRGGPLMETGAGWRSQLSVSTNEARQWVWKIGGSYATDELDGWAYGANTQFLLRFADRYTLSVTPGYERSRNTRQFYTTLAGDRSETFNQRYVFAALEQRTAYARLRMGLSITPRLSFDLYIEPFVAVGSFDSFGELRAARSSDLRLYGTDGTTITRLEDGSYVVTDGDHTFPLADGDFDLTSLRGNAVVRWDYAHGSSLYFVWAQTRDAEDVLGEQIRPGDLVDVFDAPVRDIFAIKLSYRLDFNRFNRNP